MDGLEKMRRRLESSNTLVLRYGFMGLAVVLILFAIALLLLIVF